VQHLPELADDIALRPSGNLIQRRLERLYGLPRLVSVAPGLHRS